MKSLVKSSVRYFTRSSIFSTGISLVSSMKDQRPNLLRVLTYHRVAPEGERPELDPGLISASPEDFEQQMKLLADQYHPVSLDEVLATFSGEHTLPPASVLVTFDDACKDFAEHAWPVLQQYQIPVTLFVPTAYPDAPEKAFWWDRIYHAVFQAPTDCNLELDSGSVHLNGLPSRHHCYRRLKGIIKSLPHEQGMELVEQLESQLPALTVHNPVLGWDELCLLAEAGVTLAPHTRTHPLLNRLNARQIEEEVCGSLDDLREKIGSVCRVLAYPAGGVNELTKQIMQDAGFELAFTTHRGVNEIARSDKLALRRINVGRATNLPILKAQLCPQFRHLNSWMKS